MMDDLNLDTVPETLFLPLYALAIEPRSPRPILADAGAVELTETSPSWAGFASWPDGPRSAGRSGRCAIAWQHRRSGEASPACPAGLR